VIVKALLVSGLFGVAAPAASPDAGAASPSPIIREAASSSRPEDREVVAELELLERIELLEELDLLRDLTPKGVDTAR